MNRDKQTTGETFFAGMMVIAASIILISVIIFAWYESKPVFLIEDRLSCIDRKADLIKDYRIRFIDKEKAKFYLIDEYGMETRMPERDVLSTCLKLD